MKRICLAIAAAVVVALTPIAVGAADVPLISDNFNAYSEGTTFPLGVAVRPTSWGTLGGGAPEITETVVTDPTDPSNKVMDLYDANTINKDGWLYHYCNNVVDWLFYSQFDIMLPQNTAGFVAKINYAFGTPPSGGNEPNNGRSWAAAVVFEGNAPWASGAASYPGRISYETESFGQVWVSTADANNGNNPFTYQPNVWYSVKFECDLFNKVYKIYMGPRGGAWTEITPPGGVPFITMGSYGGTQVNQVNCISFETCNKSGGTPAETAGHAYIDNEYSWGAQALQTPVSVAAIKQLPARVSLVSNYGQRGAYVGTSSMPSAATVVSVGTDDLGGDFFYIQDSTGAIRVRQDPVQTPVHQGDMVQFYGVVQRASDNGFWTGTTGEKEIAAVAVGVVGTQPIPNPISMKLRSIGGDDLSFPGVTELDNNPSIPGVYAADDPTGTLPYIKEKGLNNVGMYGRFCGRVTYVAADPNQAYYPYFYIDDGSGVNDGSLPDGMYPQTGVRVLLKKDRADAIASGDLVGRYVTVNGVIGAISASDLIPGSGAHNVRLIRAVEEFFLDMNGNGLYDPGEPFDDANNNGVFDGITVLQ